MIGSLSSRGSLSGSLTDSGAMSGGVTYQFNVPVPYIGPTEVTPSSETQVLRTSGLALSSDITINPIPSNYGLITWNGSTLTVS